MATVGKVAAALEKLAPKELAASWDNVGLQIGSPSDPASNILVTLDVTARVVEEAARLRANLIVSHHPLIFTALKQIDTSTPQGKLIAGLLSHGIALYAAHTNIDIAEGGLNDVLAEALGLTDTKPLEPTGRVTLYKLVVFVPEDSAPAVRNALRGAGAGEIGDYAWCSFAALGTGSFHPQPGARPTIGKVGELEFVPELRLEVLVTERNLPSAISAMLEAHPYEEVAYDIYRLENQGPARGLGRVGLLAEPGTLAEVALRAAKRLNSLAPKICGDPGMRIEKLAICGGSGKGLVQSAANAGAQALLTGDLGHHDGLAARELGIGLIDLGHYATEYLIVPFFASYLSDAIPGIEITISQEDVDPFAAI